MPKHSYFDVKTAILLTCDLEKFLKNRSASAAYLLMVAHNGALSGKRMSVFGRSLSRTAPGEWFENLCSFTPGSVPLRPATGDYTFSDAYVIVNSAKSSTRSRGRFFLRNGQSPARAEPVRLHYIAGKAESPPQFSPFLRIFRPPKQQNAAASVSGESGAQRRFHWF